MGAIEELKGKAKAAIGDITDNDALEQEGNAQADKGKAEREADQARAEAKAHEAKAAEKQVEQDVAERAK